MPQFLMALSQALEVYTWILIARILLTWFPAVDWYSQPFRFMRNITDPVMEPFRRLIPPLGGIDFSPIVLFILINIVQGFLRAAAFSFV